MSIPADDVLKRSGRNCCKWSHVTLLQVVIGGTNIDISVTSDLEELKVMKSMHLKGGRCCRGNQGSLAYM